MNLEQLLQTPMDQRNHDWEDQFFVAFTESNVRLLSQDPQQGPDGWPYLVSETATDHDSESVQKVLAWLATRGIGLVVNPQKSYPDFVFNYGMIWHFKETGLFYRNQAEVKTGVVHLNEGQKVLAGAPTEEYLPNYVRKVLKEFFRDQGLHQVKILMLSQDQQHYDLVFSLESLGRPPENEHQGIAEAISWFLPTHYSLLLLNEGGLPQFYEL